MLALPASAIAAEPASISGTVGFEGTAPVAKVEVCARSVEEEERHECVLAGPDEPYEIPHLAEGKYKVGFWPTGNYVVQFWHEALTWDGAEPVAVFGDRPTVAIDATLKEGARISGTVTAAATSAPVAKVEACAISGVLERCALTNAEGIYRIDGLADGIWNVSFYAMKAEADVVSGAYSGGPIELFSGEERASVDAQLIAGGQIAGTVRSTTGTPLGGVLVCATTASSSVPLACLRTPSTGAYRFERVWPGLFKVAFSAEPKELFGPEPLAEAETMEAAEGPDSYPTQWWSGQAGFDSATPIAITPPQIVSGIDASLVAPPTPATPAAPVSTAPVAKKPLLKCKRGFVKRKVHGKQRCVKRHKAKPKPRHKRRIPMRRGSRQLASRP